MVRRRAAAAGVGSAPIRLPRGRTGRAAALLLAGLAGATLLEVLLRGADDAVLLRTLALGLPSLLTLAAFVLVAARKAPDGRTALAAGVLAYLAVGLVLSLVPVGYLESVWRGGASLLGLSIWPTVTLLYWGHTAGWLPES